MKGLGYVISELVGITSPEVTSARVLLKNDGIYIVLWGELETPPCCAG